MSTSLSRIPSPIVGSDTLQVRALLDQSSLRPEARGALHLMVGVTAVGAPLDAVRPALSVVFVLDVSGSMSGEPLAHVVRSVAQMVELLAPGDKVGVVAFTEAASVVCPLRGLNDETRRVLKRRIGALSAGGGTNIEAGLAAARAQHGRRTANERQVVLLLSDGTPNEGAATAEELGALAAPMREDMSISTLGYGARHDADILDAIARCGGGQYWFVSDPEEAGAEFARALGAQSDVVVDGIELTVSPCDAVEVTGVLGAKVRFTRAGPAVALPDLRQHQTRLAVATLVVTAPREPGRLDVVDVKVRYRTAGQTGIRVITERVSIDVVHRDPQLVTEAHQAALMARAELSRAEARMAADRGNWEQAAAIVRTCMRALEQAPGYRAADGSALSECVEQLSDEATEYEQRPPAERYAKFKATQLGIEVGQGARHVADVGASSARSTAWMTGALGPALHGHVVLLDGQGHETARFPILSEMVVGRSPDNTIAVSSRSLSRRHTRFTCRDGHLVVDDLGSTNGTLVNGRRIKSPQILHHGDAIAAGDARFIIDLHTPQAAPA